MAKQKGKKKDADEIRISVRDLVEFILRTGDLDNRSASADGDRMQEGARIHRMLQKQGGEGYSAEVPFSHSAETGGLTITVDGRADGVILRDGLPVCIDEIKTTTLPLSLITEDSNPLHWAQAMCYAHFYAVQNEQQVMTVQLTYYSIDPLAEQYDGGAVMRFSRDLTAEALSGFYDGLIAKYLKWAKHSLEWCKICAGSAKAAAFPFPEYRPGQYTLAGAVYRTVQNGGTVFCQAPTGIGKTVSTLFPSVKALGDDGIPAQRIFYLTARTTTRGAAEEALELMRGDGLRMKSVTLTAKDGICFLDTPDCNPVTCPHAAGHYDRVNDAVWDGLLHYDGFTRGTIETLARTHRVCPFELSLDLTLWSEIIIGDYNHLFDPVIYLKRFFSRRGEYIFLIDEAHNLVDRARDMYSAVLVKTLVSELKKQMPKTDKSLRGALNALNSEFIRKRKACEDREGYMEHAEADEDFNKAVLRAVSELEEWLAVNTDSPLHGDALSAYFELLFYSRIAELYDENYTSAAEVRGRDVAVGQYCIDPSALLRAAMDKGRASILFSATLSPMGYYSQLLGGEEEKTANITLPSPYRRENLGLFIANTLSTRYRHRESGAQGVASMIHCAVSAKTGNYMVYFPSYQYMRMIHTLFCEQYPEIETVVQRGGMDQSERTAFLEQFASGTDSTLVGFCVMGGIYAEGIDLRGDRLIGTVIVGVGLPQFGNDQNRIKAHFNRNGRDGYAFAYRIPGMNKVMQAVGRVIRGENDRGVALLIDDRFNTPEYLELFPEHWRHCKLVPGEEVLRQELEQFWLEMQ